MIGFDFDDLEELSVPPGMVLLRFYCGLVVLPERWTNKGFKVCPRCGVVAHASGPHDGEVKWLGGK